MNYFKLTLMFLATMILVGCNEKETEPEVGVQIDKVVDPIEDQTISGEVRNTRFVIEQAIISNGRLELRQGEDFFADVSVEIYTFENDDVSGKTFDSSAQAGMLMPHIVLGVK